MSEIFNYDIISEQKSTKPNIEDIIGKFLEGDELKNAMEFVLFLRKNNLNPRWSSANSWRVVGKKSKEICSIQLGGAKGAHLRYLKPGDWVIGGLEGSDRKYLDEFISCDSMKGFLWANIKPCTRCCSCGPRFRTYAGKEFDECCGLRIINPDAMGVEFAKRLVESNWRFISANT